MSFPTKRVGDGKDARFAVPTYSIDPETGAYVPPSGGSGGSGTEYTEDAAAPANPVAPGRSLRRRDAPSAEASADGDWVTQNGTNKGEAYVKELDAATELAAIKNLLSDTGYEPVAASQTAAPIGAATAGVLLSQLVIQPTSIAPGAVTLLDGSTPVNVWPGTSAHPAHLPPVVIPLGVASVDGWALTTGVDVEVLAVGGI